MTLTAGEQSDVAVSEAVLATVAYADVFDMPIEIERLHRFLIRQTADRDQVEAAVDDLVMKSHVGVAGNLVHLPGRSEVLDIHADRVSRAATMWDDAQVWGLRVGKLPFVRMVAVTGGLAVDSVADHDDIDLFILTSPGRVWLARLATIAMVKLAARRDVDLCPNYLLSEATLGITDQSSYAARELAQMVPIVSPERLVELRSQNRWMFDHLPNATLVDDGRYVVPSGRSWLQRVIEPVLATRLFDSWERREMARKIVKLKLVASRRVIVGRPDESAFSPDYCKGHMQGNARGIELAWKARMENLRR